MTIHMYQTSEADLSHGESVLLSLAVSQIEASGLKGFTLRSLAQDAGISPSLLTYRYGSREGLILKALEQARAREMSAWDAREVSFASMVKSPTGLASLALSVLMDVIAGGRSAGLIGWIGQTASARDPSLKPVMNGWPAIASRFWSARFTEMGIDPALAPSFSAGLAGAARIGLLAGADPRLILWMNDVAIRLCNRMLREPLLAPGDSTARAVLERQGFQGAERDAGSRSGTPDQIIEAAAALIQSHGPDSLTHRLIARQSGISLSSMTHHFASLDEIMLRAFQRIYDRASRESSAGIVAGNTIGSLSADILPAIFKRARSRAPENVAMDEIILFTSRKPVSAPLAGALLAMTGRTSTSLLQSVDSIGSRADRLDGQVLRFVLTGLSEESACLPETERDAWISAQCESFLRACWEEGS